MTKPVTTCAPGDSLAHAAQLMWDGDCGCLPVCDKAGRVVGMITDRDICMGGLFQRRALQEMTVASVMAKEVKSCAPADLVSDAQRIMRQARIRRLPVIQDGALLGIVSLADLAYEAACLQTHPQPKVTSNEIGVTLASICEPRRRRAPPGKQPTA